MHEASPNPARPRRLSWIFAGLSLVACFATLAPLSRYFVFGEGHAARPIEWFLLVLGLAWAAFAWAVCRGGKGPVHGSVSRDAASTREARWRLGWILAAGVAARLVLLVSEPIQENDHYRYILDGSAVLHGVNPFAHAPQTLASAAPPPFRAELEGAPARRVLSRVSYPEIRTIYPPLAQLSFAAGAWLTPWEGMGQRLVFLAYDLAAMAVLIALLRALGKPSAWIVIYAWNPLVIKEIANSAHSDSLAGLCLVLLLAAAWAWQRAQRPMYAAAMGLALAGAVLARSYPVLLVPACLCFLWEGKRRLPALAAFVLAGLALTALAYTPFRDAGYAKLTEGLRAYGGQWRRNDGAFALIAWAGRGSEPRAIAGGLVALLAVASPLCLVRGQGAARFETFLVSVQVALLAWLLFMPAVYPWYWIALLATAPLRPRAWAVVASGVFMLYYALFLYDYREYGEGWDYATQAFEHGSVWLALFVPLAVSRWRARGAWRGLRGDRRAPRRN